MLESVSLQRAVSKYCDYLLFLNTLIPPKTAASATAYGSQSFLIIATPTMRSAEGIYTPLMYCGASGPDIVGERSRSTRRDSIAVDLLLLSRPGI